MLKKFILFSLAIVSLCAFTYYANNSGGKPKSVGYNFKIEDAIVADNQHNPVQGGPIQNNSPKEQPIQFVTDNPAITVTMTETSTDLRTYYDLQSNGVTNYIEQQRDNPLNMHGVFMCDPVGAAGFPDRSSRYVYSDDGGATWTYIISAPDGVRSGFPTVFLLRNGIPVIGNHSAAGNAALGVRTQFFADIQIGAGTFERLDPGGTGDPADQPIWPEGGETGSVSNTNKFVFTAAKNAGDSVYRWVATSLTTPGTFTGRTAMTDAANANQSSVGSSPNGKIGIAYITGDLSALPDGSVRLIESTDNGNTWGSPVAIWTPNYTSDSNGALRSIDLSYNGENAAVVFGTALQDGAGGFFPTAPGKIYFWGPNVNGGTPVLIDQGSMVGSNPTNDVFVGVTRATLGMSNDGNAIYVTYNKASGDTSAIGNDYFDIMFTYSSNGGANWVTPVQVNPATPLRDCRYPSISDRNHVTAGHHWAHIICQVDSGAASFVNGGPQTLASCNYFKVDITDPIGIENISGTIPGSYSLAQNYPNPFNPTTKIRFALPKSGFVTLKLYNIQGKEIATLVSQQSAAGTFEYELNASSMSSGVYFYTLQSGDFKDTKKLVLVK